MDDAVVGDDRAAAERKEAEPARRVQPRQHGDGLPSGRAERQRKRPCTVSCRRAPGWRRASRLGSCGPDFSAWWWRRPLAGRRSRLLPPCAWWRRPRISRRSSRWSAAISSPSNRSSRPVSIRKPSSRVPATSPNCARPTCSCASASATTTGSMRSSAQTGEKRLMRGGEAYLDASAGIPLLEIRGQSVVNEGGHAHGVANPHYWLDPENAITITAGIAEALVRIAPGATRSDPRESCNDFCPELETRRARWSETLAPFAGTKLIAYHNSWPYFARRFRLDVIALHRAQGRRRAEPRPSRATDLRGTQGAACAPSCTSPTSRRMRRASSRRSSASRWFASRYRSAASRERTTIWRLFDYNVATLAKALGARSP